MVIIKKTHKIRSTDPKSRKTISSKKNPSISWIEEKFRLLVESIKDYAIIMLDPLGYIVSWNIGAERMNGYSDIEIIGKHFSIFYTADARQEGVPEQLLKKALEKGSVLNEGWRIRKNGSQFWADILITPMYDSSNRMFGFAKITRDLTERKLFEQELIDRKKQLQDIIDSSPSVIFLKDTTGKYLRVNSQFEKLFGLSSDDIIGKTDSEIFSQDQADQFSANDQIVISSGSPLTFEESAWYGNELHTSIVFKYPLRNADGIMYGIGGIATDITERKQTETQLRETTEKINAILHASPLAILTIDSKGIIVSWNKGAESIFGWTENEAKGKVCPTVPPYGLQDYYDMIQRGINGEILSGYIRERMKKDGTLIKANISYAPIISKNGVTESIVAILEDITGKIIAEEKLIDSEQRLRLLTDRLQKSREEERLLISREIHDEFGQRLTAILIDLDLLNRNVTKYREMVSESIIDEIDSIKNRVEDTITLIKKYAKELRPSTLDHLGLVFTIQSYLREYEHNTKISCRWESDVDGIEFDGEQLINIFRIFQESLTNIARHAKATMVIVSLKKVDDNLILCIEDDGIGIRDSDMAAMTSTGLIGMKERARMIDGSLTITKKEAKGTVVNLMIPIK